MKPHIPQAAPALRFARFRAEIDRALGEVIAAGCFVLGPQVAAFEAEFASYCGRNYSVGVGSGTDAIHLCLRAAGIGPGDQVLVPSLTAAGTVQAVMLAGATPVYVDVDPTTRGMDVEAALAAIGRHTAAIVLVHLYGQSAGAAKMAKLAEAHGLFLLEDCAQAHGAEEDGRKLGSFGNAAAFSFYPTKNLGALGDGGSVVTSDSALAERVRTLRNFGWTGEERICTAVAGNSRLDEMQAALLRVLLKRLDAGNAERTRLAHAYRRELDGVVATPNDVTGSVWHQFVIEVDHREGFRNRLAQRGVATAVHYWPPLHQQPALAPSFSIHLPQTERLCRQVVSLPIQPEAIGGQFAAIVDAVRNAVRS